MANYLPCIYAFLTCAAFSVMLEVKRLKIIISCALTGCIGWFVYLVFQFVGDDTWGRYHSLFYCHNRSGGAGGGVCANS